MSHEVPNTVTSYSMLSWRAQGNFDRGLAESGSGLGPVAAIVKKVNLPVLWTETTRNFLT